MRKILIAVFIVLAVILRFLWLDKFPIAIGGDELIYVITAKSIFLKFTDLTGLWNPLSVFSFYYPPGQSAAELPYFLLAPVVGLANFSLLTARFLWGLMSVLSVFLIYLISQKLFSKNVAIFAGFIAAINPWSIYIGRTNYESVPAVFFFLLALYLLLVFKNWKILLSIPILFLAFYSYIGTKIIFLPFVLITGLYAYFFVSKRKKLIWYLLVFLSSLFLVILFAFAIKNNPTFSRGGEIFLPNNPVVAAQVNNLKKVAIQAPFASFFDNKLSVYCQILFTKFSNSLSPTYLFLTGDYFYNVGYGFFYFIDAFFLLLGLFFAFLKKKKEAFLVLAMAILGVFPQLLHTSTTGAITDNYALHLALVIPFLIIFIGVGLSEATELIKNKKYYFLALVAIIFVYLLSVLSFAYVYFFKFPLYDNFDFHVRVMSEYTKLASQNGSGVVVYSPRFKDEFQKYLFYSNSVNNKTIPAITKLLNGQGEFIFQNIQFSGCDNSVDTTKAQKVILNSYLCGSFVKQASHISVARLSDGGENYGIYNDTVCKGVSLKPYPSGLKISNFNIEELSKKDFCQTFITSP
jgi:4-amino-4-deoxy-L-arabinose transferase-like glycosyltransferase